MSMAILPSAPLPGEIVHVRQRQYLVENVEPSPASGEATLVALSCLDDDAQGEPLEVLWEHEIDAEIVRASWERLGGRALDAPSRFAAYLHAVRWNCVTATNPRLFQSPWRAGIEVMSYQLEPLRKALRLPRVNLFIADDVGLGKTIEAGLVLREMIMRQRVRRVVVAAPPSVVLQWRDELEQRFGLTFVVYDRDFVARCRRERGYAVNPWTTHTRFIISHALLRDEDYAAPLRDVLGDLDPGSMLILDEAHHAAPASSSKYAIDSHFTRAVRDLSERFEHRLFLSATPHNGLSNSFSALLEILDPQRFLRGAPVDPKLRDQVMVRRLKSDLREISGGFPKRHIIKVLLDGLPNDTPELELSRLLDQYWEVCEKRREGLPPAERGAVGFLLVNLQKRLFSSLEAFRRTLAAHLRGLESATAKAGEDLPHLGALGEDSDDDDGTEIDEVRAEADGEKAIEIAALAAGESHRAASLALVHRMTEICEQARRLPDARVLWLCAWIRREMCPGLPSFHETVTGPRATWLPRRVLIFTESTDTQRYLEQQLRAVIGETDRGDERLAVFRGGLPDDMREEIKRAFNADPTEHPLRILIATDAAREGVNLHNHCADLFHFDLPWNPSRLEQRNGRIDRKGQKQDVRCHYFHYAQREADRVLEVLVERTEVIQEELGSMPPVLEERMTKQLAQGIGPRDRARIAEALRAGTTKLDDPVITEELEGARDRTVLLQRQIDELRDILDDSRKALDLEEGQLRGVLAESLGMLPGAEPLVPAPGTKAEAYLVPPLDADPTWADTLDTLRAPRERGIPIHEWRRTAPLRPVVFRDPGDIDGKVVHLHLEHRFVQRLLGRFLAQGFALHDLARACVGHTSDPIPRVLLLGRLSLYGDHASRLHDEVVAVAARWIDPKTRKGSLKPYAGEAQEKSWEILLESISLGRRARVAEEVEKNVLASAQQDVSDLLPHLTARCELLAGKARAKLDERGSREAKEMVEILEGQRARIERELSKLEDPQQTFTYKDYDPDETEQLRDNARYWRRRLEAIPKELGTEPARIQKSYAVRAQRIEPVGIAYLWPVTG
ncbi:MAG: DISARM system SNF2-like helicase DrmD [Byssovorax sp.]